MELDYKLLLDTFSDAVVASDSRNRICYLNQAAERLFGWSRGDLLGKPLTTLMPERMREAHQRGFRRFMETHEPHIIGKAIRVPALHRDGYEIEIELTLSAFKVQGTDLIVASLRDRRERAELERQIQARALAEASEARSRFLADASAVLSESLDYGDTLARVARLAVPTVADWCTVAIVDESGEIRRVAAVHRDPTKSDLVREYERKFPPGQHRGGEHRNILVSGQPVFFPTLDDADLAASAQDEDHLRILRGLGVASCIMVPLVAQNATFGVISLMRSEPGSEYTPADLMLARELAGRAALAVQNARLFQAERRARAAAEAERMRALQLGEALPEMAWTARPDGFRTWFNTTWVQLTGLSREQSVGWGWKAALHPDDVDRCVKAWMKAVEAGAPYEGEYRYRRPSDNSYRWHLVRAMPVRGLGGEILEWVGTCADIDDKKREEVSARFLGDTASALSASLDCGKTLESVAFLAVPSMADWCSVDLLDENGMAVQLAVAHTDPAKVAWAKELRKKYPPEPDASYGVYHVIQTGNGELHREVPDELLVAAARNEEHLRIIRDLGMRSAMIVPLTARGRAIGAITFVLAESGRRYSEKDLAVAQMLADRAAQAVDNARLYNEAQEAVRARDEFLSVASHELRTPLTPLHLNVQAIQKIARKGNAAEITSDRFIERLDTIERQVRRLEKLINNLLDVSRISAKRLVLECEEMDLGQLAREVLERFQAQSLELKTPVSLRVAGPVVGVWDRMRLDQILVNLLSNALKFADGKPIQMAIEGDSGAARITVRDEGIGIPLEDQERIFGRFERAVSERHYGGLGLGLWLSRQFAEAMGGNIRLQSSPGRGSTFTVTLPKRTAEAREETRPSVADAH